METLKTLLIDCLNGFSPKYIPLFLLQLLSAGLMGLLIQVLVNRKFKMVLIRNGSLIAVAVALIVAVTKNSLPFSVLAAAAILLLSIGTQRTRFESLGLFLVVLTGVGCGVGSVVQTVIGVVLIALVLLFVPLKDEAEKS